MDKKQDVQPTTNNTEPIKSKLEQDLSSQQKQLFKKLTRETRKVSESFCHIQGRLTNQMELLTVLNEQLSSSYLDAVTSQTNNWNEAREQHEKLMEQSLKLHEQLDILPDLALAVKKLRSSIDSCDAFMQGSS